MKQLWLEKYRAAQERRREPRDVLVGFNANLDRIIEGESFDVESVEARHHDRVETIEEFREQIRYSAEKRVNEEVDLDFNPGLEKGDVRIGGQAGIVSNFLSEHGHGVIFYTPLLSETLAQRLNEKILYPVMDGDFVLKNIRDASTTDRTKENVIVEFGGEKTSRTIFSQKLRGFGPYFRKGVEDNMEQLENGFERAIVSGFHDADGNIEAKLKKSAQQLSKISEPIHLEFVHREKTDKLVIEHILENVDSIGVDENELKEISKHLGMETSDLSLEDSFEVGKTLIQRFDLSRVAIHTYSYHLTVTDSDYGVEPEKVLDGMLFGELCAISMADSGGLSYSGFEDLGFDDIHLHKLDSIESFAESQDLDGFVSTGIAELEEVNVFAIPTLIHEDPERLVGMGDVISAGSFIGEIS
ncbi:ADP-dependent glucokinase/phosphofructokinase [Candidatus Nanohalococcus occultus]|uniref:ADP-dependent glucokinase/phosphofructokinase n=1 Tax=Candidatus Nanohalococcus occultus TaxID=2978047 RepID=UPI0039DF6E39